MGIVQQPVSKLSKCLAPLHLHAKVSIFAKEDILLEGLCVPFLCATPLWRVLTRKT